MILDNSDHIQNINPSHNIFYRAVIEDNDDSKEEGGALGRCRVRILGIHPQNSKRTGKNVGVPVEELPWAELMVSNSFHGGISGKGITSIPVNGTWVWVFFDGGDWNRPIIAGIIYGISNKQSPGRNLEDSGFFDPDKIYPIEDRIGESDVNRVCRNEKFEETLISKIRNNSIDKGIPTAKGNTWNEMKEKTSKTIYPNNTVFETTGGSIIEYDSTPKNERIHFFHNSGTYWEIQNEGNYQIKVFGDHKTIINKNKYELVKKNKMVSVQKDVEVKHDANETKFIGDSYKETIKGTVQEDYNSTLDVKVKGSVNEKYSSGQTTDGGPSITIKAGVINLN